MGHGDHRSESGTGFQLTRMEREILAHLELHGYRAIGYDRTYGKLPRREFDARSKPTTLRGPRWWRVGSASPTGLARRGSTV